MGLGFSGLGFRDGESLSKISFSLNLRLNPTFAMCS